jgi:hypothetical protein
MDPSFWAAVDAVDWASYELPETEYHDGYLDVPEALEHLVARGGRIDFLGALGCDYCCVLYPVVVPATPLLIRIALEGPKWARVSALDVLTLTVSMLNLSESRTAREPDPREVLRPLEGSRGSLESLATDTAQPERVREGAEELLAAFRLDSSRFGGASPP